MEKTLFDDPAKAPREIPNPVDASKRFCKLMEVDHKKYYEVVDLVSTIALRRVVIDLNVFVRILEKQGYDDESDMSIDEFLLERYGPERRELITKIVCLDDAVEL